MDSVPVQRPKNRSGRTMWCQSRLESDQDQVRGSEGRRGWISQLQQKADSALLLPCLVGPGLIGKENHLYSHC